MHPTGVKEDHRLDRGPETGNGPHSHGPVQPLIGRLLCNQFSTSASLWVTVPSWPVSLVKGSLDRNSFLATWGERVLRAGVHRHILFALPLYLHPSHRGLGPLGGTDGTGGEKQAGLQQTANSTVQQTDHPEITSTLHLSASSNMGSRVLGQ